MEAVADMPRPSDGAICLFEMPNGIKGASHATGSCLASITVLELL
jgi:hypothetical protein